MRDRFRYLYRAYRYRWRVDPAELRFVCRSLRRGQVAVDVGCHKGAYTYWMRRRVGATGRVVAFEPQPRQVEYLRQVFAAMRYGNVTLEPQGLSDVAGRLPLYLPDGSGRTHGASFVPEKARQQRGQTVEVGVTTLDDYFADLPRGPDFVKIDVEGHELAVLVGGRQTLQAHRPALLVECETRHRPDRDVRPVFAWLESLGYKGSFFCNGRSRPLDEFDPAVHQDRGSGDATLPPGYVNNFAFVHPEGGR
jgi:FkbM family methyltransferase